MKAASKVKVLGINGSPRIGGNTDILLDRILAGARDKGADTEKIILNELKIAPCQESANPRSDGQCMLKDDMSSVYKKVKTANAIILASPIFFGSVSAQTKTMIDRFQCAWRAKYVLKKDLFGEKKIGAFVSVAAFDRKDFFENARAIARNLFATINVEYKGELFFSGLEKKGDVLKHPDFLEKAYELGCNMSEMLIKEGK